MSPDADDYRRIAYALWNGSLFLTSTTARMIFQAYAKEFFQRADKLDTPTNSFPLPQRSAHNV